MEGEKVLFLDDERNVLSSLSRLFIDDALDILTFTSGREALEALRTRDVSVIVSDNLMPEMRGIEFLQRARYVSPDSVRIMLTGYTDVQAAIDAINKGEVYKFVIKPWDDEELRKIIFGAVDRHKMVQSMRQADEHALQSLAQTIELKDAYTKGHCERVAKYALAIAGAMGLDEDLKESVRRGSWLHDCGKIGVPEAILNYPGPLTDDQMAVVRKHPCWGADVAKAACLSESVISIIRYHHERYDGSGYPSGLAGKDIPLEARIVHVADIYDALTSARSYRDRLSKEKAVEIMVSNKGTYSDPLVVDTLVRVLEQEDE